MSDARQDVRQIKIVITHMQRSFGVKDNRGFGACSFKLNFFVDKFRDLGAGATVSVKFIPVNNPPPQETFDLHICGGCGPNITLFQNMKAKVKIFWCYEPRRRIPDGTIIHHSDYFIGTCLKKGRQVSNLTEIRFPCWMQYFDLIRGKDSKTLANPPSVTPLKDRKRKAIFIARNGNGGRRMRLINTLRNKGLQVDCGGKIGFNMHRQVPAGGLAKFEALQQYVFNVCPENSNIPGYVTEKIIQACVAGCIPIYWGHEIESGVINPDRVLMGSTETNPGPAIIQKIKTLLSNEKALEEFFNQPIFLPTAHEKAVAFIDSLDQVATKIYKKITV